MVFPSLFFQNDPGVVSQLSGFVVLIFSFLIRRSKLWVGLTMIFIAIAFGLWTKFAS